MNPFEPLLRWIGANFDPGLYLMTSKIQGVIWSAADIVLVLAVLKIASLARTKCGLRGLPSLHLLLWFSALLTPLLVFAKSARQFFFLECLICGLQFLILVYVALTERERILDLVLGIGEGKEEKGSRKETAADKAAVSS